MTITFGNSSGIGRNRYVDISNDGVWCAKILRYGRSKWQLVTWYDSVLSIHSTLDDARAAALARTDWPGEVQVYDQLAVKIESERRGYFERQYAELMFALVRGLPGKLNEINALIQLIDKSAGNRMPPPNKIDGFFVHSSEPRYPKPPGMSDDEWRELRRREEKVVS